MSKAAKVSDMETRYTVYGHKGQPVPGSKIGVPLGHRSSLEEARKLAKLRTQEGYVIVTIVERERAYPFRHLKEHQP